MNVTKWMPGVAWSCSFSLGDIAATCTVTIQLKDFAGNNLMEKGVFGIYITSESGGDTTSEIENITASTGIVHELLTDKYYVVISEDDGSTAVVLTEASDANIYVNVVLPNGKVMTSPQIDFS